MGCVKLLLLCAAWLLVRLSLLDLLLQERLALMECCRSVVVKECPGAAAAAAA